MGYHGQRAVAHLHFRFKGSDAYEVEIVDYH
jgi:plasmid maintenance system killer protein